MSEDFRAKAEGKYAAHFTQKCKNTSWFSAYSFLFYVPIFLHFFFFFPSLFVSSFKQKKSTSSLQDTINASLSLVFQFLLSLLKQNAARMETVFCLRNLTRRKKKTVAKIENKSLSAKEQSWSTDNRRLLIFSSVSDKCTCLPCVASLTFCLFVRTVKLLQLISS